MAMHWQDTLAKLKVTVELVQEMELPVTCGAGSWASNLCCPPYIRVTTMDNINKVLRDYGAFNAPPGGDETLATKVPNQRKIAMAMLLAMLRQELENDKGDEKDALPLWPMGKALPK